MRLKSFYNKKILLLAYLLLAILLLQSSPALGLDEAQLRIYDSGIDYFNIDTEAVECTASSTILPGTNNEQRIFNFLVGRGLQPFQAAGLMGNMMAESHFEPKLVEYGFLNSRGEVSKAGQPSSLDDNVPPDQNAKGQPGYGLVQWTSPPRKQGLRDKVAASNGLKASDLNLQLEYIMQELEGAYRAGAYEPLLASKTIEQATNIILDNYEIPGDKAKQRPIRQGFARDILARNGSGTSISVTSSGGTTCGAGGSGQVVGGFSLPLDKKWYDEHKDWFTAPHHDYPAADIPVPEGTPVYAMAGGIVKTVSPGGDCGRGLSIDSGNGIVFTYCHGTDGGSVPGAKNGNAVSAGVLIMHSGYTGHVIPAGPNGAHLHLQIEINGRNYCPQNLFVAIAEGKAIDLTSLPTSGCTK
jgi:murein DD-endopeptidase MepM/ murein hydrolase activator NlpD